MALGGFHYGLASDAYHVGIAAEVKADPSPAATTHATRQTTNPMAERAAVMGRSADGVFLVRVSSQHQSLGGISRLSTIAFNPNFDRPLARSRN